MALETTTVQLADPSLLRDQGFIGGRWCDADDGRTFAVTNPATGELLANVPRMGAAETRRAIAAAAEAFGPGASAPRPSARRCCGGCAT
jgi:succinate-semialdehyde dehydrogenase/glutarate-semialdehyde dehydrogenase